MLGHHCIVEGVIHLVEVLLAIGLDLNSLQVDTLAAVDCNDKLALQVLFRELCRVHKQVRAFLEAIIQRQSNVRVCIAAAMEVLLLHDLLLCLRIDLVANFRQD